VRDDERKSAILERVLCMARDLEQSGVRVMLDLTLEDPSHTCFESAATVTRIQSCNFALLVGTRSYMDRASDPSTVTHAELSALTKKNTSRPGSVIAMLLDGDFGSAIPVDYRGTMCAVVNKPEKYLEEFPQVVAKVLGFPLDDKDARNYKADVENLLKNKEKPGSPQDALRDEEEISLQDKSWAAQVVVLTCKLSLDQRRVLDGKVNIRTKRIDEYCSAESEPLPLDLPKELENVEAQLRGFVETDTKRVLLLQAAEGQGPEAASRFVAKVAWQTKGFVPVFIDLANLTQGELVSTANDSTTLTPLVEQVLAAKGLDRDTVVQAREEGRSFVLVIDGFDRRGMQTNVYVRFQLHMWPGKAVFTCCSSYLEGAPYPWLYFAPPNPHQRPDRAGLKTVFVPVYMPNRNVGDKGEPTPSHPLQCMYHQSPILYRNLFTDYQHPCQQNTHKHSHKNST
jgi:hypothetical protein